MATTYERLVGQRFRFLIVESVFHVRYGALQRTTYKARCVCDCGSRTDVFVNALTQGKTGSCGCDKSRYVKTTGANNYNFKGFGEIRSAHWEGHREGAARRGLDFQITIQEGWALFLTQNRKCAISGVPIQFGPIGLPKGSTNRQARTTASLDRVDNTKGYVVGNVQWVHKVVNIMRNRLPVDEFVTWCRRIAVHHDSTYGTRCA